MPINVCEMVSRVPRTVLFLHGSSGLYGSDRQLLRLAGGLDSGRFKPLVVLSGKSELAAALQEAGIETICTPLATLRRSLASGRGLAGTAVLLARNRRELARIAAEHAVAIVHTNTSIVIGGQAAAEASRIPHVVHVREIYPGLGGRQEERLWPLLRRRLLRADALACVSQAVAAQFDGTDRAFVLHDGVVPVVPALRDAARAELGLDPDRFVVAVLGRLSDWKGQEVLARALAARPLAEIGAIGLVAGAPAPGQERFERALVALGEQLGLGERLRLLGFRRDIETILGAADAVAVPSTTPESLPNAALEAASAGLPVVASAVGGLVEIVDDEKTGRLVPPGDTAILATTLRQLASNAPTRTRLGEAAAADISKRFAVPRMLDEVQRCYERLLD